MTHLHREILVVMVRVGRKAYLDFLYVALIFCNILVFYWNTLLKLFLFCLYYRAGLERR